MAKFEDFISKLEDFEGGYSNRAADYGGPTNRGITLTTFRAYYGASRTIEDLKKLTVAQAHNIYKKGFWNVIKADTIIPQSVASTIFDHGVNAGNSRSVKMAQHVLDKHFGYKLKVDGVMGSGTVAALNIVDPEKFFNLFQALRQKYYDYLAARVPYNPNDSDHVLFKLSLKVGQSLSQRANINGWTNRVNKLTSFFFRVLQAEVALWFKRIQSQPRTPWQNYFSKYR